MTIIMPGGKDPSLLSSYQSDILEFMIRDTRNLIVEAVAGSGKSFTLELICLNTPKYRIKKLLAFNRVVANNLKSKGLPASTFNGLGYGAIMRAFNPAGDPNPGKPGDIAKDVLSYLDMKRFGSQAINLVNKAYTVGIVPNTIPLSKRQLMNGITPDDMEEWEGLIDRFNIDFEDDETRSLAIEAAREILGRCLTMTKMVSFDDQILFPVIYDLPIRPVDLLLVDESQDLNMVQMELVDKVLGPNGRLVAVGDRNQSLYQFRGAASGAMDIIKEMFDCYELPLSICYRCGKTIVEEAQQYVPHIEYSPSAVDGEVTHIDTHGPETYKKGDLVVCRNNAPLISMAYKMLANRLPCVVMGRDIGKNLISRIKKIQEGYMAQDRDEDEISYLSVMIDAWGQREYKRAIEQEKERKADEIMDQMNSLMVIIESSMSETMQGVIEEIENLFRDKADPEKVITLSTVHKMKGGEADRVFWLDPYLCPAKWARGEEEIFSEKCIQYVAVTRAKTHLFFVSSETWRG